jgi:hypothetical protein
MAAHLLVLAQRTARAGELIDALRARQRRGPIHATLVMPAAGPGVAARAECRERMEAALAEWREAGIPCDGVVGDPVPLDALADTLDPLRHDEVIVCTLPGQSSRWIQADLPRAVARLTGLPTSHVVAHDPDDVPPVSPVPEREHSPLGPLAPLSWARRQEG